MTDISMLISQMTLEEKAGLCTGASSWTTTPIERLNIPELIVSDGPHGVRRIEDIHSMGAKSLPATCFPTASCLASTWDVNLIREMGIALAEECKALKVDVLLGPGTNMKRSPLGGRNFEYFSEDPYLAGELATALIESIQSLGVGVSLKHFAANNQEYQRFVINSVVDERALNEIYLAAFEKAVKRAQPWTVMCAYNKLNGYYCSENKELLTEILKKDWGFEGLVVSDWGAVHNRVESLKAGLDWEMPGPKPTRVQDVVDAVRSGELQESVLDESVRRILRIVFKAAETPKGGSFDYKSHHALAHKIASDGMVLLKNNGILPLKSPQHIAVIGRSAETAHFQGGGSSHINPTMVSQPFKEIQQQAPEAELTYAAGYAEGEEFSANLIKQAVEIAQSADVALVFIALPASIESEGYDRQNLNLTTQQEALIKAVCSVQPNTVVILNNGSPVVMGAWLDGAAAVLEAWMMGQAGAGAIAEVLFGKINPSGKLAETFPLRLEDTPAYLNWPGEAGEVRYGEGLFIGYRYYDARNIAVQFPFGFGLSYTTYQYTNMRVSELDVTDQEGVTVYIDVTNAGNYAGIETVQLYVRDQKSSLARPPKELKGFVRVPLQPGETKTAELKLDFRSFAFYHPGYKQWITEDGAFDLLIGASSEDIRQQATINLKSTLKLPSLLNRESTVRAWLEDARGSIIFEPTYQFIKSHMAATFGTGEEDQETIGMDMLGFMMEMPLLGILNFEENVLPASPDAIVDMLLEQVAKA